MRIIPEMSRVWARIFVLLGLLAFTPLIETNAKVLPVMPDTATQLNFLFWSFTGSLILIIPAVAMIIVGIINVRRHHIE